jgi:integrase
MLPRYKHGKQTTPITFEVFKNAMEKGEFKSKSHRSFLAFLYWFGTRKSEALERTKEDFTVKDGVFVVDAPAKKGGKREPLEVDSDLPYVNLIIEQVEKTRKQKRVWNFTERTAIRIIKRALGEKYYPHFLRLNRASFFLEDPNTTVPDMKAWFGWKSIQTIDSYVGYSRRNIRKQRVRLRREIET